MISLRDLSYLIALDENQHFGKAASSCFVSQPALSMQIKKLEASLGVKLLERNNKFVFLTSVGKEIVKHAHEIVGQLESIKQIAQSAKDPFSGQLCMGIIPTLGPYLLPNIMVPLANKFPQLKIYFVEEKTEVLIQQLILGELDAAFLVPPVIDISLTKKDLFQEEFLLAVPKGHALSKKKTISLSDLEGNKEMLLLTEGHCMRDQMLDLCQTANIAKAHNFQATSLETLRYMVVANIGITLMPKLACQPNDDNIAYIPFEAKNMPKRTISLFYRKSTLRTLLLECVANEIKNILSTI